MHCRKLIVGLLMTCCCLRPLMADEYPKVLFGALPQPLENEKSFEVSGNLLQIQLTPTMVISAGNGALINLFPGPDNGFVLAVNGGAVIALELDTDQVINLPPGAYRIGTRAALPVDGANTTRDYKQGFALGDYYMVRQQSYLETLHIDVRDINKGLVSILRHLIPSTAK